MTKVYVIMMFIEDDQSEMEYAIEPLGVYSSLKKAIKYVEELESVTRDEDNCMYEIFEYELDNKPIALDWLKKYKENSEAEVNKIVMSLMKQGLVDQLIGEDGNFYYRLTKLGEEIAGSDNVPKSLKDFQEKNKKNLDNQGN